MKKSKECMKWMLLVLLVVLTGINIYNCATPDIHQEVTELQVGGSENWEKLQEVFNTEKFEKLQKETITQRKAMFAGQDETAQLQPDSMAQDDQQGDSATRKWTPVLDELAKIKSDGFIKGDKDARFTIIEYSELICPYCKRHSNDGTLNKVMEHFPWEVNIIHRSYLVHPQAQKLQEGWLCSKDQLTPEKHFTFIEKLFEESSLSQDTLLAVAKRVGYDTDKLSKCITDWKYANLLDEQTQEGRDLFGVTGTPGNVIVDTKTGKYIIVAGAYPTSEFVNKINAMKNTVEPVEKG